MNGRFGLAVVALGVLLIGCAPAKPPSPSASPGPSATEPAASDLAAGESVAPSQTVAAWSQLAPSGPSPAPREDHTWTITPDAATAYLFGGRDGATVFDDLWAYDLVTGAWSQVPAEQYQTSAGITSISVPVSSADSLFYRLRKS